MKKLFKLFILLNISILLFGCNKNNVVTKSEEEINKIFEEEKSFTNNEQIHNEFISLEDYKNKPYDIEWESDTSNVNIGGKSIKGYVVEDSNNSYILSTDGTLYKKSNGSYSTINIDKDINKIGLLYNGKNDECSPVIYAVVDTNDGNYYFYNSNDKTSFKKLDNVGNKTFPDCYGIENSNLANHLIVYSDGKIGFSKIVKDKVTAKELGVKYVIYSSVNDLKEKYYVITNDEYLYIIENNNEYQEAVAKVDVDVTTKESKDKDIVIKYGDVSLTFTSVKDVINEE